MGEMVEGLYSVLKQDTEEVTVRLASENHFIFQAHFPDNPILPGFTLIDILAEILDDSVIHIIKSKFIAQLLPNDILTCKINTNHKKRNIKIFKYDKKVSEIIYESK